MPVDTLSLFFTSQPVEETEERIIPCHLEVALLVVDYIRLNFDIDKSTKYLKKYKSNDMREKKILVLMCEKDRNTTSE